MGYCFLLGPASVRDGMLSEIVAAMMLVRQLGQDAPAVVRARLGLKNPYVARVESEECRCAGVDHEGGLDPKPSATFFDALMGCHVHSVD